MDTTRYIITYYHISGSMNEQTVIMGIEALKAFLEVLLSTGHKIISVE